MTPKAIDGRLARLEAVKRRGKLLVCRCATHNGRRNLPPGEHLGDCPALTAAPRDTVLTVRYVSDFPK